MPKMKQISIDVDVNRAIELNRVSLSERENDILRRMLIGGQSLAASPAISPVTELDPQRFGSRQRGMWQAKLGDEVVGATSLKDAYCNLLKLAHQKDPEFLERLSSYKGKSRRYVARIASDLYGKSPHLAKNHALQLVPGWFVDTNLSESQVAQRAKAAAYVSQLAYGQDVWIKERGRTI